MDNPDGWSRTVDDYVTHIHDFTFPFAAQAINAAPVPAAKERPLKCLDVACGTGAAVVALQKKHASASSFSSEVDILATDFSSGMLEYAQKVIKENNWTNVKTKVMDATAMDLPNDSFDAVSCIFGVMLMPDGDRALSEMYRVLAPGGSVTITTWHHQDFWPIMFGTTAKINGDAGPPVPTSASNAFNTAANVSDAPEKPKNWTDLDFNIEKLSKAGFVQVQGTTEKRVVEIKDVRAFFSMNTRNPVMAPMVATWSAEQIKQYTEVAMDMLEQAQGKKEVYSFALEANVLHGRKQ